MRRVFQVIKLVAIAVSVFVLLLWCLFSVAPWCSLHNLARQAKNNVNPEELRTWSMSFVSAHSGENDHWENFYGSELDSSTNFPAALRKVGYFANGMRIYTRNGDVAIFGDSKGGPFLRVGPPSLPAPTNQMVIQWKPGIYFVNPRGMSVGQLYNALTRRHTPQHN